jgi:hypothetical protein
MLLLDHGLPHLLTGLETGDGVPVARRSVQVHRELRPQRHLTRGPGVVPFPPAERLERGSERQVLDPALDFLLTQAQLDVPLLFFVAGHN